MEENEENDSVITPSVRWCIPQKLSHITFVGHDTVAVAQDIHIIFLNLKTMKEQVYTPNGSENGDGVDCISGYRTNTFAFADKVEHPRIFVLNYPKFQCLHSFRDTEVVRYKGICMGEGELVVGFSGIPNYTMTVWSWRTGHKLVSVPTNVVRRAQMYLPSPSHTLLCQAWTEGLIVWEIAPCFKLTMLMPRMKPERISWETSDPNISSVCWTHDSQLYAVDTDSILYCISSDSLKMVMNKEWSEDKETKNHKPLLCSHVHGLLIYGDDGILRGLMKDDTTWKVVWKYEPEDKVISLINNSLSTLICMWTEKGFVYSIHGDSVDSLEVKLATYKQRNVKKIQMLAPDYMHLACVNDQAEICIYEIDTATLIASVTVSQSNEREKTSSSIVHTMQIENGDVSIQASPVEPVIAMYGEAGPNYGVALYEWADGVLTRIAKISLTNQIISRFSFSPTGKEMLAAAMSAGHIFLLKLTKTKDSKKLSVVRNAEYGRGLADTLLMRVGDAMRAFTLVIFSDKYKIGERVTCINAESGKDNKVAGKMQGPYRKLVATGAKDTMIAIPHLSKEMHVLKLTGDKGVTVAVKVLRVEMTGHELRMYKAVMTSLGLLSFGLDGNVILRDQDVPKEYGNESPDQLKFFNVTNKQAVFRLSCGHRYESGIKYALLDDKMEHMAVQGFSGSVAVYNLKNTATEDVDIKILPSAEKKNYDSIIEAHEKNWLDLQEDRKVREEAMDYKHQREEIIKQFLCIQQKLRLLLEENENEIPLHQLPLSEFNLNMEAKQCRLKQAAEEREVVREELEARIKAQDKVTAWIKMTCWDTMKKPLVKISAIFSHYLVENYAILPTERDNWLELSQIEALRGIEKEKDDNLFKPWKELVVEEPVEIESRESSKELSAIEATKSEVCEDSAGQSQGTLQEPHVLRGSMAHLYMTLPEFDIPQCLSFSYLQMNWLQHISKFISQNIRLWFNKEFDALMSLKKREVALVEERNERLRVIISELNKLSALRGSFNFLTITITDPQWLQTEQPERLIKVDPEEVSIEPYVSPSQVVIPPPEPKPKDDFKERALNDMMDGVLEKLWHEEIKKPIPMPACMRDKEPENFNQEDLKLVFDYEAKVEFRKQEREKYRKMLTVEYAKLSQILNEGITKFNQKVKEMFITKLKTESAIGQVNLNLMRLRRVNLDRLEMSELMEQYRSDVAQYEEEAFKLHEENKIIQEQASECQTAYDLLAQRDRIMEKTFKNNFLECSQIVVDQCYKMFKKRPKWYQRASMIPIILHEMATAAYTGHKSPLLHSDCYDYLKALDNLDNIHNMPPVLDEHLWNTMCKLRRAKIDIEIKMRAMGLEMAYVENAENTWNKAIVARKNALHLTHQLMAQHREEVELLAKNKTIQIVMPGGLVELPTSGYVSDFVDARLIRREEVEEINRIIRKVGNNKLEAMLKAINFRKRILAKEWEHAQMKMKLRHMEQELYSYGRLKLPKELQKFLRDKDQGYTDDNDYARMEKEMEASKAAINKVIHEQLQQCDDYEAQLSKLRARDAALDSFMFKLRVKLSEKRVNMDPFEDIRKHVAIRKRMRILVQRGRLIREVQDNHTLIVMLQTELELLRLKTYPTLAQFRTIC